MASVVNDRMKFIIFAVLLSHVFFYQSSASEENVTQTNEQKKITMVEVLLKQPLHKLRLLAKNGKVTYFEQNSGDLVLAENYNIKKVMTSTPGSNYQLYTSLNQKKI